MGTEYCGATEHHEYELYLALVDVDHSGTKAKYAQTNGICERLHRTMQEEFYATTFRKKIYDTLEELQSDLESWLEEYTNERTHTGEYCFGRTPMQKFLEILSLAIKKMFEEPPPAV